jgi:hypothetical protein
VHFHRVVLSSGDVMSIADVLVPEYDMEMEATRNLLERVPEA